MVRVGFNPLKNGGNVHGTAFVRNLFDYDSNPGTRWRPKRLDSGIEILKLFT